MCEGLKLILCYHTNHPNRKGLCVCSCFMIRNILFIVFFFLYLFVGSTESHHNHSSSSCVNTQNYWLSIPASAWPTTISQKKLCGSTWYDLMKIETVQISNKESIFWFVVFHQMCTASLNDHPLDISSITTVILDNLERGCGNTTKWSDQWKSDENMLTLYNQLYQFNNGDLLTDEYPSCSMGKEVFSFYNLSDLFLIGLPTNETVPAGSIFFSTIVAHIFRLNSYFVAFTVCTILLIIMVAIMYALLIKKSKYACFFGEPEPTYDNVYNDEDDGDELSDINISSGTEHDDGGGGGGETKLSSTLASEDTHRPEAKKKSI